VMRNNVVGYEVLILYNCMMATQLYVFYPS